MATTPTPPQFQVVTPAMYFSSHGDTENPATPAVIAVSRGSVCFQIPTAATTAHARPSTAAEPTRLVRTCSNRALTPMTPGNTSAPDSHPSTGVRDRG